MCVPAAFVSMAKSFGDVFSKSHARTVNLAVAGELKNAFSAGKGERKKSREEKKVVSAKSVGYRRKRTEKVEKGRTLPRASTLAEIK